MPEVDAKNRELQAAVDAAAADTTEISTLVEQHRALTAAHSQLQVILFEAAWLQAN
jgi:hypothetical protein